MYKGLSGFFFFATRRVGYLVTNGGRCLQCGNKPGNCGGEGAGPYSNVVVGEGYLELVDEVANGGTKAEEVGDGTIPTPGGAVGGEELDRDPLGCRKCEDGDQENSQWAGNGGKLGHLHGQ